MGILKIKIENYRSIKKAFLDFSRINVLIGANGSGKSNIISAINFYYKNLLVNDDENVFDLNNKFSNYVKISIVYDFSKIRVICKNHLALQNTEHTKYYQAILNFANEDNKTITLIKIKDKKPIWEGASFKERRLLFNLFPIYTVDSRDVNLEDWSNLWNFFGDLIKIDNDTSGKIQSNIEESITKSEYKLDNLLCKIQLSLNKFDIHLNKLKPKEYASLLTQIYFKGSSFMQSKNALKYNSNGTNAFNYTNILIEILGLMAKRKVKEPCVIMDEPELSLHHNLIDELIDNIFSMSENVSFLIATHSPRIVKYIMKYDNGVSNIYHSEKKYLYTQIAKMNMFTKSEKRSRIRINDEHANAYFSRLILAMEGETEQELFENKYLREIFPELKKIAVVSKAMSEKPIMEIVSPQYRKHVVPIITIYDMDKVFKMKMPNNTVEVQNEFKNYFGKEKYFYASKRFEDNKEYKRIIRMAQRCKFHYTYPFYESHDEMYRCFKQIIREYLKGYNHIAFETTVEGALINQENIEQFCGFLFTFMRPRDSEPLLKIYNRFNDNDRLNFMRLLFGGKSDYLLLLKQIVKINSRINKNISDIIESNMIKKTSGWVSDWIKYFCLTSLEINDSKDVFRTFKKTLNVENNREKMQKKFELNFGELYDIIILIRKNI